MKFDVVTFGSAVVDVFVDTDVAEKKNFISYPSGAKILIKELRFDIGGGGTNTAVAFSRLGLKTGYIGKLGDDENGRKILALLKKEKIRFLGKIDKQEKTGYSVILDSKGGERTILTYKGANNDVSLDSLNYRDIETKWLYYSSLLGKSLETQLKLAKILKDKLGTKLAFNPSSYLIESSNLSPFLKLTEILIVNKEEAAAICKRMKKDTRDMLKSIHELGPKIILITDKNNPAVCFDGNKKYSITPHENIKVVERTGAGDAFASGFVAGIIAGKSIPDCLSLGLEESESVLRYFGAKNNLIKRKLK